MVDERTEFSDRYTKFLSETVKDVRSASLDDSYMPVINQGEYREASSSVPKRLMYYLSLFSMSLDDSEMAFPRFLLIDTPQTASIDKDKLVACIETIETTLTKSKSPGQVILTIGRDRLPSSLDENVFTMGEDLRQSVCGATLFPARRQRRAVHTYCAAPLSAKRWMTRRSKTGWMGGSKEVSSLQRALISSIVPP